MPDFSESNWARADFGLDYVDNADIYIVERRRSLEILKSFYRHFLKGSAGNRVLDLGCGDGIITGELFSVDESISATLIDGSEDMLRRAKERLKVFKNLRFLKASFQEIIEDKIHLDQDYNFIVSAQAIHHLTFEEKESLFRLIYDQLHPGGYFVNIDVVLATSEKIEQWYMSLWREWIMERQTLLGTKRDFSDIIQRYKDNKDNTPGALDDQMKTLKETGFKDVDCYYKYGIFSIYGGRKA